MFFKISIELVKALEKIRLEREEEWKVDAEKIGKIEIIKLLDTLDILVKDLQVNIIMFLTKFKVFFKW